jgi:hypothetical protein
MGPTDDMGGHIQQRPWTPTKRRGPIAAEFSSPGPASVALPGLIGKASAPSASLHYRHAEPKAFVTPAPGAYNSEPAEKKMLDHSPKYSFGTKTEKKVKSNTPAPNAYNMPAVLGQCPEGTMHKAPSYSIAGRQKDSVDPRVANPGPGKYDAANMDAMKAKAPAFSLSTRTQLPSDDTKKPGPGAYSAEKVNLNVAPAHSFGIKHSPYILKA